MQQNDNLTDELPKLVDERTAAAMLGITAPTLRGLRARDQSPPFYKIGGSIRYSLVDIRDYFERARRG